MNWRDKLQYQYNMAGVTEKLIAVNVVVFAFFLLLQLFFFLFGLPEGILSEITRWLIFPDHLDEFVFRPWTIVTYAFMHAGFWHIIGNMIILYFSGRFFLNFFSAKKMLNYYFLGAIAGAVLFMLSYNIFPAFASTGRNHLIGASASVMAILVGVAAQAPNMQLKFFMFDIKLWWIAAFFVIKDLVFIPIENPGGHIAHLGGAALGYLYTIQLHKGNDIGAWFESMVDGIVGWFVPGKKKPFKKVYRNKKTKKASYKTKSSKDSKNKEQKKVDVILDKISKSGYESLSKSEKDYLFNAGKD
jgi:membrane associated rhomboid family serine protease